MQTLQVFDVATGETARVKMPEVDTLVKRSRFLSRVSTDT